MRTSVLIATLAVAALALQAPTVSAHRNHAPEKIALAAPAGPKLETLMKSVLAGVEGTEVIVSKVTMPPHTTLPKHWHPGEEFAYVLDGSVTLWQEGKEDIVCNAGDVAGIPLEQVHTAITMDEGATILVFRVHAQGKPERVLVGED